VAHFPKPFFRSARNAWFVQIDGKQIKLAEDRDAAFRRYHGLMAVPAVTPTEARKLVVVVIDAFLDFVEKHRNSHTYRVPDNKACRCARNRAPVRARAATRSRGPDCQLASSRDNPMTIRSACQVPARSKIASAAHSFSTEWPFTSQFGRQEATNLAPSSAVRRALMQPTLTPSS
jgi:hypothetical protein